MDFIAPVHGHDVRVVTAAGANEAPVGGAVDVDVVVVRSHGEVLVVRRESHDLDPLLGVAEDVALGGGVASSADRDAAIVGGDCEPAGVQGDGARALGVGNLGEGGGTSLDSLVAVGDLDSLAVLALGGIPEHDLVVITRGHDAAILAFVKTPDLTIAVRVHDGASDGTVLSDMDGSVTGSNNKSGSVPVDGTDEDVSHIDAHLHFSGCGVPEVDLAVLATGDHRASREAHGADEFALGAGEDSLAGTAIIAAPNVDGAVGATSPTLALVVPSASSKGGLFFTAEETLLLIASGRLTVPEVNVLDTDGSETLGIGVPTAVEDLVGVTLLLPDAVAVSVVDVDLVLVVHVNGADPSVLGDAHSGDSAGTLSDLDSLHLLASAGVPLEDGGAGAVLAGDSGHTLGAESDRENIIGVMVLVSSDVLGSHVDFTRSEELLGVALAVEDDTEGGSHVDSLGVAVPVDVLLGVGASVAVDVLEGVGAVRLVRDNGVVLRGLSDLADPGTHSHELFTLSLLDLEEIGLGTVVVLAFGAVDVLAGLLVEHGALSVVHVGVVVEFAWCLSSR